MMIKIFYKEKEIVLLDEINIGDKNNFHLLNQIL